MAPRRSALVEYPRAKRRNASVKLVNLILDLVVRFIRRGDQILAPRNTFDRDSKHFRWEFLYDRNCYKRTACQVALPSV